MRRVLGRLPADGSVGVSCFARRGSSAPLARARPLPRTMHGAHAARRSSRARAVGCAFSRVGRKRSGAERSSNLCELPPPWPHCEQREVLAEVPWLASRILEASNAACEQVKGARKRHRQSEPGLLRASRSPPPPPLLLPSTHAPAQPRQSLGTRHTARPPRTPALEPRAPRAHGTARPPEPSAPDPLLHFPSHRLSASRLRTNVVVDSACRRQEEEGGQGRDLSLLRCVLSSPLPPSQGARANWPLAAPPPRGGAPRLERLG